MGFGRVVTDGATFVWLCDVFALPAYRGRGLATWQPVEAARVMRIARPYRT